LRRFFCVIKLATHLLEKGECVIFIKDILGHFDIKTTERYLHVRREVLINIESPIDSLYKKKTTFRQYKMQEL
jgi:integrase/recombinase XerD